MIDIVNTLTRSKMMSGIKGKHTKPEIKIRKFLHSHGFRFRLHRKDLPGKPDLVLSKYKLVVFVHGCFWHRHKDCFYATSPANNKQFWKKKLDKNAERDSVQLSKLLEGGWRVLVVWECGVKHLPSSMDVLCRYVVSDLMSMTWPESPPRLKIHSPLGDEI